MVLAGRPLMGVRTADSRTTSGAQLASPRLTTGSRPVSGALELRQDRPSEKLDVSLREIVRHAAELEEAHDHAGAELLHVGLDLAGDRVGGADERKPLLLREIELELVERDVLG